jgi:ATPase subunit of ABC transporter with duplicated ATPase domains
MIAVSDLSMRFGEKILFENVGVKFRPGNRYGLIGANGSGKSTFMKIMAGLQEPSTGEVAVDKGCSLGYLRQDHYAYESHTVIETVYMGHDPLWKLHLEREHLYAKADLTSEENERMGEVEEKFGELGGYTMETDAAKLLEGLGIPTEKHNEKMASLAGGWKLRVLLAQVLFGHPDILLLDEPTNHLDMTSIKWLEDFLCGYEGTVIVISHDRHFLNSVSTHIADLDYQEVRMFTGNYDEFMTTNAMLLEKTQRENANKEKRMTELKDFINRFSANASKAKQATSRQKELEKIQLAEMKPSTRVSPYIRFKARNRLGDKVLAAEKISKTYETTLFKDLTFTIGNGEKIAIIGNNGVGKTTLLNLLLGAVKPDSGSILRGDTVELGHFPQDPKGLLSDDTPAIQWLGRHSPPGQEMNETDLRSYMGKMLFRGDSVFKPVNVLSGGEKSRLIIASMMLAGANVLALDEPTNHLDLEAIEALNYALSLVPETIIFVSHDREFVNSLATRVIEIEDGQVVDYPGKLDEFLEWKSQQKKKLKK